jgi:hypothetical protein
MRKKQQNNPLIKHDEDNLPYFVSPNRRTYRQFLSQGLETERVCGPRSENETKEFKQFRKDIARKHGSKTGQLKKKHINRERIEQENVL